MLPLWFLLKRTQQILSEQLYFHILDSPPSSLHSLVCFLSSGLWLGGWRDGPVCKHLYRSWRGCLLGPLHTHQLRHNCCNSSTRISHVSGLHGHQHSCSHTHIDTQIHIIKITLLMKVRKLYFYTKFFMMQTQNSMFQMSEWMGNEFVKYIAFIF